MADNVDSPPGEPETRRVTSPERPSPKSGVPMTVLEQGTVIGGFRLLAPIGAGGMGRVWLADDEHLGRKVALKLLPPEEADDEGRSRFLREARALARIDHPHVVHVFASGIDKQIAWMALEYIEGDPLCDLVAGGAFDEETALSLVAQAARGLAAVHKVGVVHRDIKPDNLLLDDAGLLRVVDFGVALIHEPGGTGGFTTRTGIAVGTPHYMAPEQARGGRVDHRADIWGLGATLYALLTGRPPFFATDDDPDLDILARVLREPVPDVRTAAPVIAAETAAYLQVLLAREPDHRPDDLDQVAEQLEALAELAMRRAEEGQEPAPWSPPPEPKAATQPPEEAPARTWEEPTDPSFRRAAGHGPPRSASWLAGAAVLGGLLVVGAAATFVISRGLPSSAEEAPLVEPEAASAAPPAEPVELVLPTPPPVEPAPQSDAEEQASEYEPEVQALLERVRAGGKDGTEALEELVARGADATPVLVAFATEPGTLGPAVLSRIVEVRAAQHVAALEAALFNGERRRAFEAVRALEQLRNMQALQLLQRAASGHPEASVREAARKAARSMFSVEGER